MTLTPAKGRPLYRDLSGPPLGEVAEGDNLLSPLQRLSASRPNHPLMAVRTGDNFVDRSAAEVWTRVRTLARGLIASGVARGDRVAIMAATRLEWFEMDLAINAAGAVTVPIYETSSADQIAWILSDSAAVMLVVESESLLTIAKLVQPATCREILTIETGGIDELAERATNIGRGELDDRITGISGDTISTIIYTSGTTGRPKGCVLTHNNLRSNVHQVDDALKGTVGSTDTALLFLPLAHVLTKMTALYCLEKGVRIAFGSSIEKLPEELDLVKPTLISAVPRVFEKVFSKAQHSAESGGKGRIFDRAVEVAIRWSRERAAGSISARTRIEHWAFERLVYRKLAAAFGGNLRMAFSGGGPLGERLASFFDGTGVRIYEGYGLTETSPIVTISRTDAWRPGSVGTPVAATTIRIESDGELLVSGPQVFQGYWQNSEATSEVFDEEGLFRTGDIGTIDEDGFVHITGRKKELIVTAAGKNVAPAPLEDQLRSHTLVSQAMVIGDARPFIAALVTIDEEAFRDWTSSKGRPNTSVAELTGSEELGREIQAAIDAANRTVSRAESIRKFVILPADFSLERGEVTPTLKVRRMVVTERYEMTIEEIYS